jgi:hypothetical protein
MATKLALTKILKGILHIEDENYYSHQSNTPPSKEMH